MGKLYQVWEAHTVCREHGCQCVSVVDSAAKIEAQNYELKARAERAEAALRDVVAARNKVSMMLASVAPSRENGLLELYEVIDQARAVLPKEGEEEEAEHV